MSARLARHIQNLPEDLKVCRPCGPTRVLAWRIPGTGEPGGLLSMGSHRVGHDWRDAAAAGHVTWEQQPEEHEWTLLSIMTSGSFIPSVYTEQVRFHSSKLRGFCSGLLRDDPKIIITTAAEVIVTGYSQTSPLTSQKSHLLPDFFDNFVFYFSVAGKNCFHFFLIKINLY